MGTVLKKIVYKLHALGFEGVYVDIQIGTKKFLRIRFW